MKTYLKKIGIMIIVVVMLMGVKATFASQLLKQQWRGMLPGTDVTDNINVGQTTSWVKVTKAYTDFSTAGLTRTITVYQPVANEVIHTVIIKPTVAFTGGTIATYTFSMGLFSNTDLIAASSAFTVPTIPFVFTGSSKITENSSPSPVTATAISTVGLLNAATSGTVEFYILRSFPTVN